tara:strand:+ start:4384 stop:4512 length:129 start_codon:yes stop_codon:yes gene_type:complete
MKTNLKTIKIDIEVHKKLTEIGKKGETFSEIINKLIEKESKK